jgi:hypothetical protein
MTATARPALVSRDSLSCKDGKSWYASASVRGQGLDSPWPFTSLDRLRIAWPRREKTCSSAPFGVSDWRTHTAAIRRGLGQLHGIPWRVEDTTRPILLDTLWLDAHSKTHRLEPDQPIVPTRRRDDAEACEGLQLPVVDGPAKPLAPTRCGSTDDGLAGLTGQSIAHRGHDEVFATTRRVHAHTGSSPEALAPHAQRALGAEAASPDGALSGMAALDSNARLAHAELLPAALFDPRSRPLEAFRSPSRRLRIAAVTPLCFGHKWLPDGLDAQDGTYRRRVPCTSGMHRRMSHDCRCL